MSKAEPNNAIQPTLVPRAADGQRYGAYPRSELRRKLTPVVTESAKL